jgi:hypothetical protein
VAAAHYLMMPRSDSNITINADGTSYQTGGGLTDRVKIFYKPVEQAKRGMPLKSLPVKGAVLKKREEKRRKEERKEAVEFVKFYLCMNCTGVAVSGTFPSPACLVRHSQGRHIHHD